MKDLQTTRKIGPSTDPFLNIQDACALLELPIPKYTDGFSSAVSKILFELALRAAEVKETK